jgi:hypothetical protein
MEKVSNIYLLDGYPVDKKLWTETLKECIATVQTRTSCPSTKRAIESAILEDIRNGMTSVVNGHQFAEMTREVTI